jgi:hypothetical protein
VHRRCPAFSGSIKTTYDDTCAFTGLKIVNGGGRIEVQAAHIRPVVASGPDSLRDEAKTSVRDARYERFDFLGYTFGPHRDWKDGVASWQ